MVGVISAFGVDKRTNIAAGIMIVVANATSIWNAGIQTATAQNLLAVGFMDRMLGARVTWLDWLKSRSAISQLNWPWRRSRLFEAPSATFRNLLDAMRAHEPCTTPG